MTPRHDFFGVNYHHWTWGNAFWPFWIRGHKLAPYGLKLKKWSQRFLHTWRPNIAKISIICHVVNIIHFNCIKWYREHVVVIVLVSYLLPALICWTAVSWKSCTAITFGLQRKLPPPINPREKVKQNFKSFENSALSQNYQTAERDNDFRSKTEWFYNPWEESKYQLAGGKNENIKSIEIVKTQSERHMFNNSMGEISFLYFVRKACGILLTKY